MRSRFVLWIGLPFVLGVACGSGAQSHAPDPPVSTEIPDDLKAALPLTSDGKPLLYQSDASGMSLGLAYDPTLDDATARWGSCLSRVLACYRANPKGPIGGCIDSLQKCKDDTGGVDCCPPSCVTGFHKAVAAGMTEDDAVDASFVDGTCVSGFAPVSP